MRSWNAAGGVVETRLWLVVVLVVAVASDLGVICFIFVVFVGKF
jgi:hypothetical protein